MVSPFCLVSSSAVDSILGTKLLKECTPAAFIPIGACVCIRPPPPNTRCMVVMMMMTMMMVVVVVVTCFKTGHIFCHDTVNKQKTNAHTHFRTCQSDELLYAETE